MHGNEENIDKLFSSRLGNFEVTPPPEVWERISDTLNGNKRRNRVIWLRRFAAAASVIIAFLAGWYLSVQNYKNNTTAENSIQPINHEFHQPLATIAQEINFNFELPAFQPLLNTNTFNLEKKSSNIEKEKRSAEQLALMNALEIAPLNVDGVNFELKNYNGEVLSDYDRNIINKNLAMLAEASNTQDENHAWSLGLQVAPAYHFDGGVSNKQQMDAANAFGMDASGSSQYQLNATGGFKIEYRASKRLSIQTGVGYNAIAQKGGNVAVSFAGHNWPTDSEDALYGALANSSDGGLHSLSNNRNASNNAVVNTNQGVAVINMPDGTNVAMVKSAINSFAEPVNNYDLAQQAGYVELPVAMRYMLIDGKIGLHVLGGINANVLVQNNVQLNNGGNTMGTGTIEGLKPLTFSSSLGMGLNYHLSKRLNLSIEPTIKMLFSSLNEYAYINSKPYMFGLYSGISYNF